MADLFDRFNADPDEELPAISSHDLTAMLAFYHNGTGAIAIKNFFNMDVDAQADFDALTTKLDSLTALQKVEFLILFEAANNGVKIGLITTKAEYASFLGI